MTFIKNITTWRSSLFCCHVQRGQTLGLFQPVNATTGAVGTSMNPSTQSRCSSERQKTCGAHQRGATMHGHLHCSQRIDKGAQTAPRDSACPANGCRQAQLGNNLCHVCGAQAGHSPFRDLWQQQGKRSLAATCHVCGCTVRTRPLQGADARSATQQQKTRFPGSCV